MKVYIWYDNHKPYRDAPMSMEQLRLTLSIVIASLKKQII